MVEIRARGHEYGNKLVFHLADLFHDTALNLRAAAEGALSYYEVLRQLGEKAREKHCERWLDAILERIASSNRPRSLA